MMPLSLHERVSRLSPDARRRLAALIDATDREAASDASVTLIGYYVSRSGRELPAEELRQFLSASLPAHLLPTRFCHIDRIPRTVHGKVDTAALPSPAAPSTAVHTEAEPPASSTETQLLAIWSSVLGIRRITRTDSFFELGGDSLLAIRLLGQIRQQWNIEISIADLFSAPTVAASASRIDAILWARDAGGREGVADGEREEVVF